MTSIYQLVHVVSVIVHVCVAGCIVISTPLLEVSLSTAKKLIPSLVVFSFFFFFLFSYFFRSFVHAIIHRSIHSLHAFKGEANTYQKEFAFRTFSLPVIQIFQCLLLLLNSQAQTSHQCFYLSKTIIEEGVRPFNDVKMAPPVSDIFSDIISRCLSERGENSLLVGGRKFPTSSRWQSCRATHQRQKTSQDDSVGISWPDQLNC